MALTLVADTDSVTETDSVGDCVCGVVVDGYPRAFDGFHLARLN